ncbi:MAG TPA: hypothetical protein PKL77_07600 [Candidatus Omnitrophota bacterium]|nr:hypothetical protein [Candidatus Omnitrophota bacterium]HNX81992.1 hypothetical protein [Candidatus Omnitrophota bacterium]
MKIKHTLNCCAAFFVAFSLLGVGRVWAVDLPHISQSKIRLSIPPGESRYGEITVENPSIDPRSMKLYMEDWYYTIGADGTKEFAPPGTLATSAVPWISFSPSEITIPPFGKQKIGYSVKVPADAKGSRYASLFFENLAGKFGGQAGQVGASVDVIIRIASLFYIEVEGTVTRAAEISNISVTRQNNNRPLIIEAAFNNTGSVDLQTASTFDIMDKNGMVVARGEFNDVYTFPSDKGLLKARWKEEIPEGIYDLIITMDLGKAQAEAGFKRGPVITKEARISIGPDGEVQSLGDLH